MSYEYITYTQRDMNNVCILLGSLTQFIINGCINKIIQVRLPHSLGCILCLNFHNFHV